MRATITNRTPAPTDQLSFSFTPVCTPQGDGSFVVRPGKPVQRLTAMEAARRMRCSVWTVYAMFRSGILVGERPTPHKILIDAGALEAHLEATRDPEFWDRRRN